MKRPSVSRQFVCALLSRVIDMISMGAGLLALVCGLMLIFADAPDRHIWTLFGICFAWVVLYFYSNQRRLRSTLKSIDAAYGTEFNGDQPVGFRHLGDMVLFDSKMKKVLFLKHYSRCIWMFNYADIESWQLSWDEKSGATRMIEDNFRFLFELRDIDIPTIKMYVSMSRPSAEAWSHRIGLILRGEKRPEASKR